MPGIGLGSLSSSAQLSYQPSLHAGTSDADGKPVLGTEIMHLVPHQGRLYAGNSLWMENDPQVRWAAVALRIGGILTLRRTKGS